MRNGPLHRVIRSLCLEGGVVCNLVLSNPKVAYNHSWGSWGGLGGSGDVRGVLGAFGNAGSVGGSWGKLGILGECSIC